MNKRVRFHLSFRARLMLLLASFLILTVGLVVLLDNWAAKRADAEIERQSQQVTASVNDLIGDFTQAVNMAQQSLNKDEYIYQIVKPETLPPAVEHIIITDIDGKVHDSTLQEMINEYISV